MTDYLNPAGIYPDGIKPMEYKSARIVEPVNQCVSCGAEMGEGNQVCPACIESWTIKDDGNAIKLEKNPRYFINGRELDCDKAYDWFREAIQEKSARERLDENGLARCGCGGKAERSEINGHLSVSCESCGTLAWDFGSQANADKAWNTAMGYHD
jgi:hypothetical protein